MIGITKYSSRAPVPEHEIAAAIAAAREPVGVRGKRSREHR
jgi:hypothetical protein